MNWGWLLFSFNGRISRMYYWLVVLLFLVVEAIFLGVFFGANMGAIASGDPAAISSMSPLAWLCALPLTIAAIWIGLAVAIKRWHDRAKSGWWVLIGLIPIIGPIWVLIECGFLAGTAGANQYGLSNVPPSDPLSGSGTTAASAPPPSAPPPPPPTPSPAPPPATAAPDAGSDMAPSKDDNPYAPQ